MSNHKVSDEVRHVDDLELGSRALLSALRREHPHIINHLTRPLRKSS